MTTLGAFVPGAIRARVWVGLPLGLALISLVAWNATILSRERDVELGLALGAFLVALALRLAMRRWSWLGAQLFAAATLASIAYLLYAASITFVVGREPFYLITSTLLLVLEVAALTLSLSYLFEIVDTTSRTSDRPHPVDSNYLPRVAIQVPAYNEPLEVMTETLNALAQLDYPDLIISSCTWRTGRASRPGR
ncbi:MAG: hypothetical protein E6H83_09955 [Chloroflexi bacterium]|nr:MAG: hypothetical protein E6H83_09955 [Chloroflexota bacterium]